MRIASLVLVAALMGAATSAPAQITPSVPAPAGAADPVPPPKTPGVTAANADVAAQAEVRSDAVATTNAEAQAQYAEDMAAYRASLVSHHRTAVADAKLYDRQQRAYADAMAAWRHQVYACKHGSTAACKAPPPDPATFW